MPSHRFENREKLLQLRQILAELDGKPSDDLLQRLRSWHDAEDDTGENEEYGVAALAYGAAPPAEAGGGKGGGNGGGGKGGGGGSKAPTGISLDSTSIQENSDGGTVVGTLTTTDASKRDTHTYQLTSNPGGLFAISGDQLVVAPGADIDYEAILDHIVTIEITVTDSDGNTFAQAFNIEVLDVDESGGGNTAPTDILLSNASVDENAADGTVVGQFSNDDPDAGDVHTYTLVDDFGGAFRIEGDQLVVNDPSLLDFETNPTIDIVVQVSDGTDSYQETMTIGLNDLPEGDTNPYYVDALLAGDQYRWNYGSEAGTGVVVTYSFMTGIPAYYDFSDPDILDVTNFMAFTQAMMDAAESALAWIAAVADITFEFVASAADADIAFGSHQMDLGIGGYTYYPEVQLDQFGNPVTDGSGNYVFDPVSGDVWISSSFTSPTAGQFDYLAILHEIGHALGLQHPGDYDGISGGTGEAYLPAGEDNRMYTVMSYTQHPDWAFGTEPQTLMVYDIAALQYLYGANTDYNVGDTVYNFGSLNNVIGTIWDAGGYDTFDASGETHDMTIDLNEGAYSSIGSDTEFIFDIPAVNNIGIAFGTEIEAAVGGSGDDLLIGNALDNSLSGNAGIDWFVGGGGNDTIDGGAGADVYYYGDNGSGDDLLVGFEDGLDMIDFSLSAYQYGDLAISSSGVGGADTLIEFDTGSITIAGVTSDQIDTNDFLFADLIA